MIRPTELRDQKVAVFGLARSGLATCRALALAGARVAAWDDDRARRETARARGFALADPLAGGLEGADALVVSPGVPLTHPAPHPVVRAARVAGVRVMGDIELFARALPGRCVVGVTGTNGKSTTTALIGHILAATGHKVEVGGNIGRAALELEPLAPDGIYVLELSSFQLDLTYLLACRVAVWLNLGADHLDRHGDIAGYLAAKRRIFRNQSEDDWAVVGIDDRISQELAHELAREARRRVLMVSAERPVAGGIGVEEGRLVDDMDGHGREVADLHPIATLPGRHNHQNAAIAYGAVRALGLAAEPAARALASFQGLPHRMETVARAEGIRFVNDSKATNPESASRSLVCFSDIYWIAGGRAKPGGFSALLDALSGVRRAFLIGEAADELAGALEGRVPYDRAGDLATAFERALAAARAEGAAEPVVLLAPACASFDQFRDFEERGERFRALALELARGGSGEGR